MEETDKWYEKCELCPRRCKVNRNRGETGFCRMGREIKIARAALHFWEEPELSGAQECGSGESAAHVQDHRSKRGSGTVFFTGCNLRCVFCQNHEISRDGYGRTVSVRELASIFLDLQKQGALNINLVTAFMFMPDILIALKLAREEGLSIPVVYNSSGYESVELLRAMDGSIDIYLPDLKYVSDDLAAMLSNAVDYPKVAKAAIAEMIRQTNTIVRHLVLPGHVKESKRVLSYLQETYYDLTGREQDAGSLQRLKISIMSQYTPIADLLQSQPGLLIQHPELNRRITKREYDRVVDYALSIGITNAYIQDRAVASESFIPPFGPDKGVKK